MLSGRVAIVTGSGRGIGLAAARRLAGEGAKVVVNDLHAEQAEEAAAAVRAAGAEALAVAGSVTEDGFPDHLMKSTADTFGAPDIIVNNAGFLWDGMLHKMSDKQWEAIVDCHVGAPFRMVRAAAPYMRDAAKEEIGRLGAPRDRSIVNVSSTSGLHGNIGQANYSAAKMGVVGLTKTIAKEWGPLGVRANAVAFGMIETRMTSAFNDDATVEVDGEKLPQGIPAHAAKLWSSAEMLSAVVPLARKGTTDEAAGGILFLASPLAGYVTGHTLEVTGGMGI